MDNKLKSKTRLAFIQYIFLSLSSEDDQDIIKNDFDNYFHNLTVSSIEEKIDIKIKYNKNKFNQLTDSYASFSNNDNVSLLINQYVNFERKFDQWSKINQAIILAIISEIHISSKDKIKILLNDYLNIAKSFVTSKEFKMINAILDKYLNEKKYI